KTGALLGASVRLGLLAGAQSGDRARWPAEFQETAGRLDRFAEAIGLAFQAVDDILDVEGDAAGLGRTAGTDAQSDKPTYVSVLGLAQSKRMAGDLHEQALAALEPLGPPAQKLRELADLIVLRRS